MVAPTRSSAWLENPTVPTAPGPVRAGLDLPRWSPASLEAAATVCAFASASAMQVSGLVATPVPDWSGPAAQEAVVATQQLAARVRSIAERLARVALALQTAADQAATVAALVEQAEHAEQAEQAERAHAAAGGLVAGGLVVEPVSGLLGGPSTASWSAAVLAAHARSVADAADVDLARVLIQALAETADRPAVTPARVVPLAAPAGYASTWGGLSHADQLAAIADHPDVVGATDGIPAWARDRANRLLLDRVEATLTAQVEALSPPARTVSDLLGAGGTLTVGTFGGGAKRVAYRQAVDTLAAVRSTRAVLDQRDGQERRLLVFDVSGRQATVAVAVGDVDTADHVAVLVDGFTTTVARDLAGADALATDLAVLSRRAAMGWGDRGQVAVVTWLGYDTPQTDDTLHSRHSVVLQESAKAGAASLAPFLSGLDHGQHLTLVGHSYGSTVAGLAVARGGTGVDDLVVMGSPGLGTSDLGRIGIPGNRVHVLEARDDPVADLGWFGTDPSRLAGIDRLSTGASVLPDGLPGAESVGHSAYLLPGTTSQWGVAAVVTGTPPPR